MYSREGLLDFANEDYVVSFIWAGPNLSYYPPAIIFILEHLSTGDKLQRLSLGPIYLLPQSDMSLLCRSFIGLHMVCPWDHVSEGAAPSA